MTNNHNYDINRDRKREKSEKKYIEFMLSLKVAKNFKILYKVTKSIMKRFLSRIFSTPLVTNI